MSAVLYAACCMNRALMVPEAAPPLLGLFSLEQAARAATPAAAPLTFRNARRVSGLDRPTPFVVIATLSPSLRVCAVRTLPAEGRSWDWNAGSETKRHAKASNLCSMPSVLRNELGRHPLFLLRSIVRRDRQRNGDAASRTRPTPLQPLPIRRRTRNAAGGPVR